MVELVGILNLTPDSFSGDLVDPEQSDYIEQALQATSRLVEAGATYIDIGAQSTRPRARYMSVDEEWTRLEPILPELSARYQSHLSIDTFYPEIVQRAAKLVGKGFIVNDVTGFNQPLMIQTVAELGLRCIVSHLPVKFKADIQAAHLSDAPMDSLEMVKEELLTRRGQLIEAGVQPQHIILDPGIGFGKTMALNRQLLAFAAQVPGMDVMIGFSKKRFLGEHRMEKEPNQQAAQTAIAAGARYLRVHNPEWYTDLLP